MSCYHKMLAKRHNKYGTVKFIGAVSKFTPEQIKQMEQTDPFYTYIKLPCGRCVGCRLDKSREWAVRIMHETRYHDANCFITLTFDEEKLYQYFLDKKEGEKKARQHAKYCLWTLDLKLFQDFMKRLRKEVYPTKIRFFHVGEYGSYKNTGRPHHHAIIFGYDFPDRKQHSYKKLPNGKKIIYYTSQMLSDKWKLGHCYIGQVTEDSAAYCARYTMKKINGDMALEHYNGRKKEYITMSRNNGIGYQWLRDFKDDVYPEDWVFAPSRKFRIKPPRYYDKIFDILDPVEFEKVKLERERINHEFLLDINSLPSKEDTLERSLERESIKKRQSKKLVRSYENEVDDADMFTEFSNKCAAFCIDEQFIKDTKFIAQELSKRDPDLSAKEIAFQFLNDKYGDLDFYSMFAKKPKKQKNFIKSFIEFTNTEFDKEYFSSNKVYKVVKNE